MAISYIFLLLGTCIAIWGSQTRGIWSQKMSIIGGAIWIVSLGFLFFKFGMKNGLIGIVISFVVGAVCQNVFPKKI